MSNYSKIYWLTRLNGFENFFIWCVILSSVALLIFYIILWLKQDDEWKDIPKGTAEYFKRNGWIRKLTVTGIIISCFGLIFIPDKNEAIVIMVGGKTMNYIQSDSSLSKLPNQTTAVISQYLDNVLKDLKEK